MGGINASLTAFGLMSPLTNPTRSGVNQGRRDMADQESQDEAPAELNRKKWSGKKIIMIVVPLLLVAGGGGYAAMTMLGGSKDEQAEEAEHADKGQKNDGVTSFIDLEEMLVNLKTDGETTSYLKLKVSLEVTGTEQKAAIEENLQRVTDGFQVYLRELRIEDLSGSAGMFRLKEELMRRINVSLAPNKVDDILFQEMLVQ